MIPKLTFHFQSINNDRHACARGPQQYVKVMMPSEDNPFPGKRVIVRTYMDDGDSHQYIQRGAQGGLDWFNHWREFYAARPWVYAWEGPNEPQPVSNPVFRQQLCAFTIAWGDLMLVNGYRSVGWNISTGNLDFPEPHRPNAPWEIDELLPSLSHIDFVGWHGYGYPNLWDQARYHVLRYRKQVERIRARGYAAPKIILGEIGVDGGIVDPPLTKQGWIGILTPEQFKAGLLWAENEFQDDDYLICATLFTSGPNGDWQKFDVAPVADWLVDELPNLIQVVAPPPSGFFAALKAAIPNAVDLTDTLIQHPTLRYARRNLDQITEIVYHHSGPPSGTDYRPQHCATYHVANLGWPGIGYHGWIDVGGTFYLCQPPEAVAYHVGNAIQPGDENLPALGVVFPGNNPTLTAAQKATAKQFNAFMTAYHSRALRIMGHRDVAGDTECPGANITAWLAELNAPPVPVATTLDDLRRCVLAARGLPIPYTPDFALWKFARAHMGGAPQTPEVTCGKWIAQGWDSILYCEPGQYQDIRTCAW